MTLPIARPGRRQTRRWRFLRPSISASARRYSIGITLRNFGNTCPSGEDVRGALRAGEARVARDQQMEPLRVVAGHVGEHVDAAVRREVGGMAIFACV